MGGPGWLSDIFAAVMLTVAGYCASRLVAARWWRRPTEADTDGAHVVMGVAMAGMLVTGLRTFPAGSWEAVFAVGAGWFGWRMVQARRGTPRGTWSCPHPMPHLIECAAMLFMLAVLPAAVVVKASSGMGGMGGTATESRFSIVALVLAVFMFGYVAWVGDRLPLRAPALAARVPDRGPLPRSHRGSGPRSRWPAAPASSSPAADGLPAPEPTRGGCGGADRYLAPRCAALCKMAMGVTMGYMLILML